MKKRVFAILLILLSLLLFTACLKKENTDKTPDQGTEADGNQNSSVNDSVKQDGSDSNNTEKYDLFGGKALTEVSSDDFVNTIDTLKSNVLDLGKGFEGFDAEVNKMYKTGVDYLKIGAMIPAVYGFTFAEGSVSSLRYAVGLLLSEKGVTVSSDGLICNWDEIYGISLTTPVPYYMEAISVEKTDKGQADTLKEYGAENPLSKTMVPDTEMLKGLSADELKTIYDMLVQYENKLYELCKNVPVKGKRSKNGFSSEYHMLATMWYIEQENFGGASETVEKVVLTAPFVTDSYSFAAYVNLAAGDVEKAAFYVNNGLLLDDMNGDINLFASVIAYGTKDTAKAKDYLEKAKKAGVSEHYSDMLKKMETAV
ncbi:MAG: hypothetical protein IKP88_00415 [Lachnospiraceae bacterium]|nr:hypothetical protein [Lachnospiraceae bacterium]